MMVAVGIRKLLLPKRWRRVLAVRKLTKVAVESLLVLPGNKPGSRLVGIQKAWQRLRRMAQIPDLRIHDLRHSFASVGAGAGLGLPVIGALLGHSQAATTQRYAHLAADPLKQASDLIAAEIAKALGT
jgi:integrase